MKTQDHPQIKDGDFTVKKIVELNYFDLTGENSNTKGASAKFYHAELQIAKSGANAQIFTMYGPTGKVQAREWRIFTDEYAAQKEFNKIISSKKKKGYKEIDVAQRVIGSTEAMQITKPVVLKNAAALPQIKSNLNDGQRRIIDIFFGSQAHFVATTLKCPVGQLTNTQIDSGKKCLDQAKAIVNQDKVTTADKKSLVELTNDFYALIPHNHGGGFRDLSGLLLDSIDKIMQKEDDLETLLDAKLIGAQVKDQNGYDAKYKSLNADIEEIGQSDSLFIFISDYFENSKVKSHGYVKEKVNAIWRFNRKDDERSIFEKNIKKLNSDKIFHDIANNKYRMGNYCAAKRPDLTKDEADKYMNANVWMCWHGTRSANLIGITKKGLLIRPSGAVHTGSMFGDGKYFAHNSTKSLNYCDGGYYTGGKISNRYMFLLDVGLGNVHLASQSKFYKKPPSGYHSVLGKAGHTSGLINDEMITYDSDKSETQSSIRYLIEIT